MRRADPADPADSGDPDRPRDTDHPGERGSALARRVADAGSRAEALRTRAAGTLRAAREVVAGSEAARLARYGQPAGAHVVVAPCAWCGRVRSADGLAWRAVVIRASVGGPVRATHTICPQCEVRHFPPGP
jgi:hypothetical protein